MNKAILEAVAQFTEFKSDKNYKLSALVKLCEDYIARVRYRNPNVTESEFYELFWCFTPEQLADISAGTKTYNDF
jgi:hypothetical protein